MEVGFPQESAEHGATSVRRRFHPTLKSSRSSEAPLLAWYRTVKHEDWNAPAMVKARFPKASIVGDSRVVFNIRGNHYRLVAKIDYRHRIVFVRFVGTHADYDRIDAREV